MCRKRTKASRQRGFGAVAAIIILVILASLGAFIVTLSSSQQAGSAIDVQGTRIYYAANAGLEWGKYQTVSGTCAASTTLTFDGTTVVVACTTASTGSAVEAGLGSIYQLTATACSTTTCPNASPGPLYVERRLSALVER